MKINAFFRRLIVCAFGVSCAGAALAASRVWQGTTGGSWDDPTRWSGGEVPTLEDEVSFSHTLDCGNIALTNDVTVAKIQVNFGVKENKNWVLKEFSPIMFSGRTNTLSVGNFVLSGATGPRATKQVYFDLKELRVGSFSTPFGSENAVFLNGIIFANTAEFSYSPLPDKAPMRGTLYFNGETVFDTSAGYGMLFDNISPYGKMSLKTRGTAPISLKFSNGGLRLTGTTLESGSTLVMRGRLNTDTLTLAAGATLSLTANVSHVELGASLVKDPTATIEYVVPADLPDGVYPVFTGAPGNDFVEPYKSLVTLSGAGKDSVTLTNLNGSVAILKGTLHKLATVTGETYEWAGTEKEASWAVAANWRSEQNDYPGARSSYTSPHIRGIDTSVINYWAPYIAVGNMRFMDTCGPLTIKGSTYMHFSSNWSTDWKEPIASSNRFPTVIANPIKKENAFAIREYSDSYIEYAGTAEQIYASLSYCFYGDIRLSGRLLCGSLFSVGGPFTVQNGGRITAPNSNANTMGGYMNILEGGTVEILGGWFNAGIMNSGATGGYVRHQFVDGDFQMLGTFSTGRDQHYYGSGVFELGNVRSHADADFHLGIAGGLTFIPTNDWTTVTANATTHFGALLVEGDATLGAKRDWRYGVASDAEETTTTVADRALRVCEWATLTVDTENPDTGDAQTITLDDPIYAYGTLVKKGAGSLALATTGNVFNKVTLRGGDIAWTTDNVPTFAALSCQGGALAPAVDAGGAYVPAVVTSDTDVTGFLVSFPNGVKPGDWQTVLKTTGDAKLSGEAKQKGCAFRIVAGNDGDELQVCKAGFSLIVR